MRHPNPKAVEVGKRIRHAREALGLSQAELGAMIGVSDAAITQYEGGRNLPRLKRLEQIGEALRVTTEWLLTGAEPDNLVRAQTSAELRALELIRSMSEDQQATALAILAAIPSKDSRPR